MSRKQYLINRLFELDESYLEWPLHSYSLPKLEVLHIKELNKTHHIVRWKNEKHRLDERGR